VDRHWESGSRGIAVRTSGSDTTVCHEGHDHCVRERRSDNEGSVGLSLPLKAPLALVENSLAFRVYHILLICATT
jgi:hypothetical protein